MDQADSWYTLTLGLVYQDKPAVRGPKKVTPMTAQSVTGSQDAAMYKKSELRGICFKNCFKEVFREPHTQITSTPQEGSDGFHYYAPKNRVLC